MKRALILGLLVATHTAASAQTVDATEPPVVIGLLSPEPTVRSQAARELLPPRIFELDAPVSVRASMIALRDADPWIRQAGLGGLALLLSSDRAQTPTNGSQRVMTSRIRAERGLHEQLIQLVRDDVSADVAVAAATPLMLAFGENTSSAAAILDRVDSLDSIRHRVKLLHALTVAPLADDSIVERIAAYFDDSPIQLQREAADVLLTLPVPPQNRFADYLRLVETPATFADPVLLHALPRFDVPPEAYIDRLIALQQQLETELAKPPALRSITVYNDAFARHALDEAVAKARARAPAR